MHFRIASVLHVGANFMECLRKESSSGFIRNSVDGMLYRDVGTIAEIRKGFALIFSLAMPPDGFQGFVLAFR